MRIFIYKLIIVFLSCFLFYKLTIGYTLRSLQSKISFISSKENVELLKSKIREEISNGLKKEKIFNKNDSILINEFIKKIKQELNP